MKQKRVLIYSRVSTTDKGQNTEVQAMALREYCSARGWDITEEIADNASGGTDDRPGLKRLMSLARSRKVDVIVVARLDRLFRSLKHMVTTLEELQSLKVLFISVAEAIDQTTAAGRLQLQIMSAFAEFERALIRERTMSGLEYARSQNKVLGRPKVRDDSKIHALRSKGLSVREIAALTNVSKSSVQHSLSTSVQKSP
jgi:putative DNA-invertase from lambdoid prophage Rac